MQQQQHQLPQQEEAKWATKHKWRHPLQQPQWQLSLSPRLGTRLGKVQSRVEQPRCLYNFSKKLSQSPRDALQRR